MNNDKKLSLYLTYFKNIPYNFPFYLVEKILKYKKV